MNYKRKRKDYNTSVKREKCIGIAFGIDQYTYSNKRKRTYTMIILCWLFELETVKYSEPSKVKLSNVTKY